MSRIQYDEYHYGIEHSIKIIINGYVVTQPLQIETLVLNRLSFS